MQIEILAVENFNPLPLRRPSALQRNGWRGLAGDSLKLLARIHMEASAEEMFV